MKKILGLVISHRKLGNSEVLVKEIMGSIPGECTRELIRLTDLKIQSCIACYRCLEPGSDCPLPDDFNFVLEKIKAADALIIGVPVYILGAHGYYKMLTDRLVGVAQYLEYTISKPCAIVIPYGTEGWQGYSQAGALVLPRLLGMKLVDCWSVHATLPAEALLNDDNLIYARKLGQEIFSGREYGPGPRECIACGSDLLRLLDGKRVECPLCGAIGNLDRDNIPDFSGADYNRFAKHEMDEHWRLWLGEMKQRFREEKEILKSLQKVYRDQDWWIKP